jgi:2-hydroxyacyl-CoA lyase 1
MGKGIVADSSPNNLSAARSAALKSADVVLLIGARLNWILTFGLPPKWKKGVKIIQIDHSADELGKNGHDPSHSLAGDINLVVEQILTQLGSWRWTDRSSPYYKTLQTAKAKNEEKAAKKAAVSKVPMTYEHAFAVIKETLNSLSRPETGDIVYVSEGANAMDISRSIFTMEHPRIRLDAGTYATMGVGLGYAIAAYAAYNYPKPEGLAGSEPGQRKKIIAIEGDSAFGFSGMEIETMARYRMDILVFIINNSGLYRGDADNEDKYRAKQDMTVAGTPAEGVKGLSALSLGYETAYHKIADMAGAIGLVARTPEELRRATEEGFKAKMPVVVNVIMDTTSDLVMVCIISCVSFVLHVCFFG